MPPADNSKIKLIAFAVLIILLIAAGVWYMLSRKPKEELPQGLEVPALQFQTNPVEKVPEINPVEKANPFKYDNPLR